jgi:hypothetical protein
VTSVQLTPHPPFAHIGLSSVITCALLLIGEPVWSHETNVGSAVAGAPPEHARVEAIPAQASASPSTVALDPEPAPELLNLTFTGYAWLTSVSGTTGVAGLEFDIDESFFDLVGKSDRLFGLMGSIDAEYKGLVFELNGALTHAEFSNQRSFARTGIGGGGPAVAIDGSLEIDAAWFEIFGGYRFIDRPLGEAAESDSRLTLDGFIGGRFTTMEVQADVIAQAMVTLPNGIVLQAGESRSLGQKEGWAELFLGGRIGLELGEHWLLGLRGDVGGFGIEGSAFSWQAVAGLGYRWHLDGWSIDMFGGYRALGQDYSRGGFTWDVITHGPILGAQASLSF